MAGHIQGEEAISKTLLVYAAPIELGWLLQFIARARYKAQGYGRTVVVCEEQYRYLFEDFANEIETYPVQHVLRDRWLFKGKLSFDLKSIITKYPGARWFDPNEDRCKRDEVKWFRYGLKTIPGEESLGIETDILIHARNLPNVHYDRKHGNRNWPDEKWTKFIEHWKELRIAYIGSKEGARNCGECSCCGFIDYRGINICHLGNLMARTKVIVGESSGPLHLAALCGCPVVTWSHKHKEKSLYGHTNRWRYEKGWNPFSTPVTVLDKWGWSPPVSIVVEAVEGYL